MKLKHSDLGSLRQIADALWKQMNLEIERNGYSELTYEMESSAYGILDIISLNNVIEESIFKKEE